MPWKELRFNSVELIRYSRQFDTLVREADDMEALRTLADIADMVAASTELIRKIQLSKQKVEVPSE